MGVLRREGGVSLFLLLAVTLLNPLPASAWALSAGAPSPNFTVTLTASTTRGAEPLLVSFSASVLSGTPTWYSWDFGDQSYYNNTPANAQTVAHTYTVVGTFNASVTVSEASGDASNWILIHVVAAPFVAAATATPDQGVAPLTTVFQGSASGGSGTYTRFQWSFGNGQVGVGSALSETYTSAGDYRVELNVTDSSNNFATTYLWVNVSAPKGGSSGPGSAFGSWEFLLAAVVGGFLLGVLVVYALLRRREPPATSPSSSPTEPDFHTPPGETDPTGSGASSPIEPTPTAAPEAATPAPTPLPVPSGEMAGREVLEEVEPPSSTPTPMGPDREPNALRVSERVVLHLASQGALGTDEVAPLAFSQAGMAQALRIRQNALTNVLRRLEAAGVLVVDTRHVIGRPRRMKVYRLTGRGESLARDLRRRASSERDVR